MPISMSLSNLFLKWGFEELKPHKITAFPVIIMNYYYYYYPISDTLKDAIKSQRISYELQ